MMHKNTKQFGRSMIEMLGVLAIVGILSAGGIAGYSMAMTNHKTNVLIDKFEYTAQQIRTLYQGNYSNLTGQKLVQAGMIKDYDNPFGGVFSFSIYGNDPSVFIIRTDYNVPADACVKFVRANLDNALIYKIKVLKDQQTQHPINNINNAVTYCKGGDKRLEAWYR